MGIPKKSQEFAQVHRATCRWRGKRCTPTARRDRRSLPKRESFSPSQSVRCSRSSVISATNRECGHGPPSEQSQSDEGHSHSDEGACRPLTGHGPEHHRDSNTHRPHHDARRHYRRRSTPGPCHRPSDGQSGQERPDRSGHTGQRLALGVRRTSDQHEDEDPGDVEGDCRPGRHAARSKPPLGRAAGIGHRHRVRRHAWPGVPWPPPGAAGGAATASRTQQMPGWAGPG